MQEIIKIENGSFFYEQDNYILKDLNLSFEKNKIVSILGLNGKGKSTLLFILMKIFKLHSGTIINEATNSYMPQNLYLPFDYNVEDIVLMGRAGHINVFSKPKKIDLEIVKDTLDILKITHLAKAPFKTLSGGQKQLVLFAKSIVSMSDIIFLDEPTSALDLKNQNFVLESIVKLKYDFNTTVIFTTHNPNHALAVSEETIIINDCKCIKDKSENILSSKTIRDIYKLDSKLTYFNETSMDAKTFAIFFKCQLEKNLNKN